MNRPTLAEVDARIAALRTTFERITTNLAALDDDLTRQMLDASSTLRGRTEEAWVDAHGRLDYLWKGQLALRDAIDRIDSARGHRTTLSRSQLQEVADLLDGPTAIVVTGTSRSLTEGPTVTTELTVDALQAEMSAAYDAITAVIDRAAAVWSDVGPTLSRLDTRVTELERVAAGSGERPPNELTLARRAIRIAEDLSRSDPLGFDDAAVSEIGHMVDRADASLAQAVAAREEQDADAADARAAVADCLAEVDRVSARCAVVAPRIAGSEAWSVELDRIGGEAGALVASLDSGDPVPRMTPVAVRNQLTHIRARADALADEARAVERTATGLLATRDELRGRLDAYRAKASAQGRAEDLTLDELFVRARDALYEAPCDLDRAGALAHEYQRAVRADVAGDL